MARALSLTGLILWLICSPIIAQPPIYRTYHIVHPVVGQEGAVAAAEKHAAEAGLNTLKCGGNAVDAAVSMGFTLAVTLPRAGNIGGGGFMIFHEASSGKTYALDYREMAPHQASRDMFLNEDGDAVPQLSRQSPLAIGVPGSVAGLLEAHERFGSRPLEELLAPAIRLAREGYIINADFEQLLKRAVKVSRLDETARKVFHRPDW